MNRFDGAVPSGTDWTAQQILAWMDSFRALVLQAQPPGTDGRHAYDRIRAADPMRRVRTGQVCDGSGERPARHPKELT